MHRFRVELSDVDRGVYETLDIRAARHPSETARFLLARVIAYCLRYQEGIELGRGISSADEPAVWVRDLTGEVRVWIDIGRPSVDRLHRASKTGATVVVIAHEDPEPLLRDLAKKPIHRQEELELITLPGPMLDRLEAVLDRNEHWTLTVNEGALYLVRGEESLEGTLARVPLPTR
jgi:uncharacterized protein YaeQ